MQRDDDEEKLPPEGARLKQYIFERRVAMGFRSEAALLRSFKPRMSRSTMSGYYHGNNISPSAGDRLAEALGVTYRDLLEARDGVERPQPTDEWGWLRAEVAAGVEDGFARVLAQLRDEGLLPAADTKAARPRRRRPDE